MLSRSLVSTSSRPVKFMLREGTLPHTWGARPAGRLSSAVVTTDRLHVPCEWPAPPTFRTTRCVDHLKRTTWTFVWLVGKRIDAKVIHIWRAVIRLLEGPKTGVHVWTTKW